MSAVEAIEMDFGKEHFGQAPLGDARRVRLLVKLADRIVARPGCSLPTQVQDPAAYQALLGLVDRHEVTHSSVLQTHLDRTCALIRSHQGTVLILHDTTELDYSSHKSLKKLGQIGDGKGRGYECHNSLALVADTGQILGLANQILHHRADVPDGELTAAKREREDRESLLWPDAIDSVERRCAASGPAPQGHKSVHVFDRGGDTFENLEAQSRDGRTYVGRSNQNRAIYIGHEGRSKSGLLHGHARPLAEVGRMTVCVPAAEAKPAKGGKPAVPARAARLAVVALASCAVQVKAPAVKRGKHGKEPVKAWVVRVWEVDAPEGVEPLEWILLTNHAVTDFEGACEVKGWYEARWTVEDYHKAKKTGCSIEKPQFTLVERLEPVIALLSVVAIWLLQLRWLSRQEGLKETPAQEVVPAVYVEVLSVTVGKGTDVSMSAGEFFLGVARLGGYDYRRKGREPGWLVLWRGWGQLQSRVQYALAARVETLGATQASSHTELVPDAAPSG